MPAGTPIVKVVGAPGSTVCDAGVADKADERTFRVTKLECEMVPSVAVMVTG